MDPIANKLNQIDHERRRRDAFDLLELIDKNVPDPPVLWEDKSVGFGDYHYVNKTSEGDMPILAFVPAKAHITVYFTVGGLDPYVDLLDRIGKYKRGKICLYISNLDKVNIDVLEELIQTYYQDVLEGKAIYT